MTGLTASTLHILVVDDSAEIREFLQDSVLEPAGYAVTTANDGSEGLQKAQNEHPDLIILDYEMPRMNGVEMLRGLAERKIEVPVILVTSYGSESIAVEVFRLGVRDYVPKPFTVEEMLGAIERVLHTVRLEHERDALLSRLRITNSQLTHRVRELDTLYHVSKSVTSLRERDTLLERIVDAALYLTGAMDGALIMLNPTTGLPSHRVIRARSGVGVGTPADEPDILTEARDLMLTAPIQIGNKTLGALTVSNKRSREALDSHDQKLLRMLGDYAAIAIENSRLLAEVEAQREREKREIRQLFEHYVAPSVVERILQQPERVHPGGQRQTIAVLFADLRGFTTFAANTAPEILISVLNEHIAAAARVIREEEGTLDKFMGDEIMAFFNAPLPQPAYAVRAVRAAASILEATARLHAHLAAEHRLPFAIGISTGEAIVGNVGTSELVNFTVVGPTVNTAHTLQELAPGGKILICQRTYELVRDAFATRPLASVSVKGHAQPLPIHEVVVR